MTTALLIPCYNFASGIQTTFSRLQQWRQRRAPDLKVIFIDDGSTDKTGDLLDKMSRDQPWSRVIHHATNRGKGAAIRSGFEAAQEADLLAFTDCDLHYGLDILVDQIYPALDQNDVVIVDRSWLSDAGHFSWLRRLSSGVFNRAVSVLTGVNFRDTQSGLKGFRIARCAPIMEALRLSGFSFDVEMLSLAAYYRLRIKQIPIAFEGGVTPPAHSTIHMIWTPLTMMTDLLRINWNWKRGYYTSSKLRRLVDSDVYSIQKTNQ